MSARSVRDRHGAICGSGLWLAIRSLKSFGGLNAKSRSPSSSAPLLQTDCVDTRLASQDSIAPLP